MIKFIAAKEDGTKALFLGLTKRNLELMRQDRPITVIGDEIGCDHDIHIFYGVTDKEILKMLARNGLTMPESVHTHYDDERQVKGGTKEDE